MKSPVITRSLLITFTLPAIMQGLMYVPAQSIVLSLYAKEGALTLAMVGAAAVLARVFDAVTDPLVGVLSDAWHRRTGSRKPFIVIGTLISMLGMWFLYRPPEDVTIVYFTGWFLVTYFGWTVIEIPYRAWSYELSSDYGDRAKIMGTLGFCMLLGTLLFFALPYLFVQIGLAVSTDITLETLGLSAVTLVIFMPLLTGYTVWRAPNGRHHHEQTHEPFRELLRTVFKNGPLIYLTFIVLITGLVSGLNQGISFLYMDSFLGLGEHLPMIYMMTIPATLISIPFWTVICQRFDRPKVYALVTLILGLLSFTYAFLPQGGEALPYVIAIMLCTMLTAGGLIVAAQSLFGDVIDYGKWKFNRDHAGVYSSFNTLVQKFVSGIAVGAGFILLGWFGFDATSSEQTASGVFGIKLVMAYLPAIKAVVIAPLIWYFPINRERHSEMMEEIEMRELMKAIA